MKCIVHNDIDAVWQCNTCGWWLCKDCIHNFSKPICPSCNLKYWEQNLKDINSLKYTTPLYWFWFGLLVIFLTGQSIADISRYYPTLNNSILFLIFILALYWLVWIFTYISWIWIGSRNQDTITIRTNDNLIAMIIRKIFKLCFALMIWIFVWPYKLYKLKQEYKESIKMIGMCKNLIHK